MGLSATDKLIMERVEGTVERFLKEKDSPASDRMREHSKGLALAIIELVPDSYERTVAISKVEESVMWAISAAQKATG